MEETFLTKHSRQITIINLIGIVFCIILIICTSLHHELSKKTYLSVQLAPSSAILTLDNSNKELRTGTYELQPGHYSGVITASNFTSKNIEFEVKARQSNSLNEYITHTKEGLTFFEKSPTNISILRQIENDQDVASFLDAYDYKSSIYDELPLYSPYTDAKPFVITVADGRDNPQCLSTLCITTTEQNRSLNDTRTILENSGYNLDNYNVIIEKR